MHKYRMGDNCLGSNAAEKEPGITVDHNPNMSQQCNAVAKEQMQF